MTPASKYWQLLSLTASGKTKVQEISLAKEFLWKQFPDLKEEVEISDSFLQKQLVEFNFPKDQDYIKDKIFAQFCLRCYISHQIELVCLQLEQRFGREHDFSRYDILPLVLEDTPDNFRVTSRKPQSNYKPISVKILETFNIQKATLATWVTRLVKQDRELNLFLLQKGVYLISNWAILNDTSTKLVKRVLREFHNLSEIEISQAAILLASYHAVYRQDRLKQRQAGGTSKCKPPTEEQLQKIASLIQEKNNFKLNPEAILSQLQDLANLLREYRLYVRGGKAKFEQSFDAIPGSSDRIQSREQNLEDNQQEQGEFLQAYRQEFLSSLDLAIATVVKHKYSYLAKKKGNKEQHFIKALRLFHCQGKSMGEIAPLIDLKAQYQVTRLLKLKELRADIRQKLLQELRDRTVTLAKKYTSIEELGKIEMQLETALIERIDTVMQEAEAEASIAKNRACCSVFASRLCHYLKSEKLAVGINVLG
ncbi:MAG: hypothetical protein QNJ18_22500 [Xenococcaceae cyanobacterium MO_167.B52]|nr:hypothetical protein [Xenococcaceae cyanobacterium MO_167.B52]